MERELTKSEKISLGTREIAKRIRRQLKEEFPGCKFSVVMDRYSGGSSITVALMKADRKVKQDFDKIPENTLHNYINRGYSHYTKDELEKEQNRKYHQLGHGPGFYHYQEYDGRHWCNGVFLTYQGYMLLKRVSQIANQYNYDDSDSMADYYSVNFSFSLQLGTYDKPFIDGESWIDDKELVKRIEVRDQSLKTYYEEEKRREKIKEIERKQRVKENKDKPHIPSGATHIIDGSGLRPLMREERELGKPKDKLLKRWFKDTPKDHIIEL